MNPLAETLADDGTPAPRLAAGQRVFGRYVLMAQIGRGAMGVVWRARDEALGEDVALKFIPEIVRWDAAGCTELKAETRRARALAHPNIVRVHDWVEDAERAAIAMEFVDGQSLAEARLARPGQVLEPADILAWFPSLCAALDYAHREARLVHRDLKPANLLLARDGTIKLADFGVARGLAEAVTRASQTATSGTLLYMSPQQALGEAPTPSDDIYALGATLYELLTGRPPFYTGHVLAQIQSRRPESLAARRRALGVAGEPIPAAWEQTIAACLAKRAELRPASAGELATRLAQGMIAAGAPRAEVWRRARPFLLLLGLAVVAGVLLWRSALAQKQPDASPLHVTAVAQPLVEYREDFDSGLGGWVKWGEPLPQTVEAFQGRRHVFDNNGDDMHASGITSSVVLAAPSGFGLETAVYVNVTNPAGCHLSANVGLTKNPDRWMDALGAQGDNADSVIWGIAFEGDACWGAEAANRRHAWFRASYTADDGTIAMLRVQGLEEPANADDFVNRWVTLRIEVADDRTVRFWCDDKLIWAPEKKIHARVLAGQRLVVSGRSLGSAGKAYHDWVRFRPSGSGATMQSSPPSTAARGETVALGWRAEEWQAALDGQMANGLQAARVTDGALPLVATAGKNAAWRSRRIFSGDATVSFEGQPLLQSSAGDTGRIGWVADEGAEPGRFVGVEFRGGEVWLIDTAQSGAARRIHRLGTYTPGAWLAYTLEFHAAGQRIEVVGSLSYASDYRLVEPLARNLRLEVAVTDSADGMLVRPPQVIWRASASAKTR